MFVFLGLFVFAVPAQATPSDHSDNGNVLNASTCNTKGSPILNITFNVINDRDSGVHGNVWANDSYSKHIQVWQQEGGTNCAIVKYSGQFVTFEGDSPNGTGILDAGIMGTFNGGYYASFEGVLNPDLKYKGNIGSFDYACNGTYTCSDIYNWLDTYFTDVDHFNEPYWSWVYTTLNNGSWTNASTGNLGDIYSWKPFESFTVPATSSIGIDTTNPLLSGVMYKLMASGTYKFANWTFSGYPDVGYADTMYSMRLPGYSNTGSVPAWISGSVFPTPVTNWLELWVNNAPAPWVGDYSSHNYSYQLSGAGALLHFSILDDGYGDNVGGLGVTILEGYHP